tara:strand:- start:393 stop:866 length:474 start_codon:yes stop_codon:yes gene_type:complete
MKLYLSNIILNNLFINNIEKYLITKDNITELYSDEGVYVSKNNNGFKKLDIIDGNIKVIKSYINDHDLFIDESYVYKSKNFISRLPSNHCIQKIIKYEYKQSDKSPVTLVIEKNNETNKISNIYFMLVNKHGKYSIPDINNPFTLETIEFFYDLLHI